MSAHWRLALRGAGWMVFLAILVAAGLFFTFDAAEAGSFVYGAGMGIVSFISMAITVSLFAGRPAVVVAVIALGSFFARLGFAVVALGAPAYLDLWPVLPMVCGFAAVYVAENLLLLKMAPKTASGSDARRSDGGPGRSGAERKVGV